MCFVKMLKSNRLANSEAYRECTVQRTIAS